ncbi:hypothetical protein U0070_012820 [Myodes glareolus]|uniref:Uncharacterized protein n=1 Tax=Myodes glareolus TaxID=447135 RepID=A0AAW0HL88_MYOGA
MFLNGVRRQGNLWKPSMDMTTLPKPVRTGWIASASLKSCQMVTSVGTCCP